MREREIDTGHVLGLGHVGLGVHMSAGLYVRPRTGRELNYVCRWGERQRPEKRLHVICVRCGHRSSLSAA